MAYTKIHAVKTTVNKTIAYICNPQKTDSELLISAFGTSKESASIDFDYALCKTNSADPNKAFHLIQSFSPGEVSYDEAHQIGIELADKLLEGKYSYVIATHIDKNHCHNHIVFCAADNIDHKKYHDCKKSYYHIRELSDQLCEEHHLSVIIPGPEKGKKYNEWLADKNGTSWKTQLRNDIDSTIQSAKSYDEFITLMTAKGYEVKGETLGEGSAKYISFKPIGSGNFIRGRTKSLGANYTKEKIKERIEEYHSHQEKQKVNLPYKRHRNPTTDYSRKSLIDTSEDKFQNSPGLQHWAEIQNLKIAASIYSQTQSISSLKEQIELKGKIASEAKSSVVSIEHELKRMGELLKYAEQYIENEPYNHRYKKSKNPDYYYRTHDTQLVLYAGAKNVLERNRINLKHLDIVQMKSDYNKLLDKKLELQNLYKSAEKDQMQMRKKLDTFESYLGKTQSHQEEIDTEIIRPSLD